MKEQPMQVIRRNGDLVPFDVNKIEIATRRAFISLDQDSSPATGIAGCVVSRLLLKNVDTIYIEDIQTEVQEEIMRQGYYSVASHFIAYRYERARLRLDAKHIKEQAIFKTVVLTDGSVWSGKDLKKRIRFAATGLGLNYTQEQLDTELRRSISDGSTLDSIKSTVIMNSKSLVERDMEFSKFAGRIMLTYFYEETLGWDIVKDGIQAISRFHKTAFKRNLERGVEIGRINPVLLKYDLERLANAIDAASDLDFEGLGIQTLYDRYFIIDKTESIPRRLETVQLFFMRVAMGLFINDLSENVEDEIISLYKLYKGRRFCSSTPTLFNSGTLHSQLSSCYLYKVDDNIESIMYRGIAENAFLSKWAGGLGGSWTAVRGTGAKIHGTNGESQGVVPFLKLHNDQLVAINQGGKRRGSGCAYLETWHSDVLDFLALRKNVGDERRRTHDMNTANWIPDLFMKRVEARGSWTLFHSNETPELHELFGKEFESKYEEYESLAKQGGIYSKSLPALDVWKEMLKMIFETGHPWLTFKDPCNIRNPQSHVGVIHSSNLCCMTGDQKVATDEGIFTVKELYDLGTPIRVAGKEGISDASEMFLPRPDAPIVKIVTKEGYEHKVTPDHRVWVVGKGWTEAQHLVSKDKLCLQQVSLFGKRHQPKLALIMGLLAGDGTYHETTPRIDLWKGKMDFLIEDVECYAEALIKEFYTNTSGRESASLQPKFTDAGCKWCLWSAALGNVLTSFGFNKSTKLTIPEVVWKGTRETVENYLRGLYLCDATVQAADISKVCVVSLTSTRRDLLQGVQLLWSSLGVKSTLTNNHSEGWKNMPDGKGGSAQFLCKTSYRLIVTSRVGCQIVEQVTGLGLARNHDKFLEFVNGRKRNNQQLQATFSHLEELSNEDAYCLKVNSEDHSWTVQGLITHNTEIALNTSQEETAVCNLGSVVLENHLTVDGGINHHKLKTTIRSAIRALDSVIDINFYPTEAARLSNMRNRPIGLGVMGLQNCLYIKRIPFGSEEAVEFSDEIMEAVCYYAYEASSDLASQKGSYSTFKGSKWSMGILPPDSLEMMEQERGLPIKVKRGGKLDWEKLRDKIVKHGMRNSNVVAIAPTATISNIMGSIPCIEPAYKNFFAKSNLSGEFIWLNSYLVKDLKDIGLWSEALAEKLKYYDGELENILEIPTEIKALYKTSFGIPYEFLINAAARRQKWIDQSQSLNLFLATPDATVLSKMYKLAWHSGLKTTYYLRTLGASNIEKATTNVKKEIRGLVLEDNKEVDACSLKARREGVVCTSCE